MSRSAGTLITTHNATFIPPRFMPGYRGHCPTTKYDYGETYGNATSKYFQDYRSEVLNSSHDPFCRGGEFPTYYTHRPETVISARTRTRDRWLHAPKYSLSNVDFDRKEELHSFDNLAQNHREYYTDKSGTKKRIDYFLLPKSAEQQIREKVPFWLERPVRNKEVSAGMECCLKKLKAAREAHSQEGMILATRHTDDLNLPYLEHVARRRPILKRASTMYPSQREREIRDVVFEKR